MVAPRPDSGPTRPELQYMGAVAVAVWRALPNRTHLDLDDLVAAAFFGYVSAKRCFDPEKGPWMPYLGTRCRGAIYDWLREIGRGTRSTRPAGHLSLSDLEDPDAHMTREVRAKSERTEELRDARDHAERLLETLAEHEDARTAEVIRRYYMGGESQREIGRDLDVHADTIYWIARRGREWLELRRRSAS